MYHVSFSPQASSYFHSLQKEDQERIRKKFLLVQENPFRFLHHYEGQGYKLRIGDHRALIDVDQQRKIVFVRVFDKRGRIYK